MKLDKHRFERQKQGFFKWRDNNYRGTWEWCTGMGKTFASIVAVKKLKEDNPNIKAIVVCPTTPLVDQWTEETKKHGVYQNFNINTVHTLVKNNHKCDVLILDELHKYIGEEAEVFPTIFEKVNARYFLGLSASIGTQNIQLDLINQYCPIIDTITTEEAVENGWLSPYVIYNYGVNLTPQDRLTYSKLDSSFYKWFAIFNYSFDMVKECLNYNSKTERFTSTKAINFARRIRWDHQRIFLHALNTMRAMRQRKDFLYSAPTKLEIAKQIVEMLPDEKIITFSQVTQSADDLSEMIGSRAKSYHSNLDTVLKIGEEFVGQKVGKDQYKYNGEIYSWNDIKKLNLDIERFGKKRLREYILEWFKSKSNGVLCTATALDVGYDDEDITTGIIISATSKDRQNIQRTGRIIRAKKDKRAKIIQLYIRDTQDEKWLDKRQTSNDVKHIVNINQIK